MRCSDIEFDSSWPSSAVVRLNSNPIMDGRGNKLVMIRLAITVFEIVQKCVKVCLKVQTKTIVSPVHVSIVGLLASLTSIVQPINGMIIMIILKIT